MSEGLKKRSGAHRILIVEDEPALRMGFQMSLSPEGFDVATAENGAAALERIVGNGEHFDLVITDLRMPEVCGADLISAVRKAGMYLPWIVVSAWIELPVVVRLVSCGVADFLKKPTTPDELRTVIDQVLREEAAYGGMDTIPEGEDDFRGWCHTRVRRTEWDRLGRLDNGFFNPEKMEGKLGPIWQKIIDCVATYEGEVDPEDPALKEHPLFKEKDWFSVLALNAS